MSTRISKRDKSSRVVMSFVANSYIFCLLANLVACNEAARILAVFPTPSISHQVVFRPLTQELARRGHEVTVITPDPAFPKGMAPNNLTEIDVHEFSYEEWRTKFYGRAQGEKSSLFGEFKFFLETLTSVVEMQFQSDEVLTVLQDKNTTFDLLLLESCVQSILVLSHIYKAPTILISSFVPMIGNYDLIGGPTHPLLHPTIFSQRIYNLSNWEKIEQTNIQLKFKRIFDSHEDVDNAMLRRNFGPDIPLLNQLKNNVDMLFLNTRPVWEGNYPVPPSVVYLGGLHQKPHKDLPGDLKQFLDESNYGVIYMSFGTNVNPSTFHPEKIQSFVKVFSQLPYDILLKWDKDDLPGKSKNIRVGKWFPQSDLLRHPKVKLFITQGGLQSTDEAIAAGVPLVGIPMFGDQFYNVEKYLFHKIGVRLDVDTLTETTFREAIELVIEDESFRRNVAKLRSLMRDEPQPALERAVWWTEHVLRQGGAKHLRAPAANLTWGQYYEMPLVTFVLTLATIVALAMLFTIRLTVFVLVSKLKIK